MTSTAGAVTLTVKDPSGIAPGRLVNGAAALPAPLVARAGGGAFAAVGAAPLALRSFNGAASGETVGVEFRQRIGATDTLRSGSYAKTLTFTLATTTP